MSLKRFARKISRKVLGLLYTPFLKFTPYVNAIKGEASLRLIGTKGKNCIFEGGGILLAPENVCLGDDVFIGKDFFIKAAAPIVIGSYTHISRGCVLHTANHNAEGETLPYDRTEIVKPIEIGRFVWIGMNVNILPGVTIGDGAIIGMGTTVSKNVGPGEVVVGAAARCVGRRNPSHTQRLVSQESYLKLS